MSDVKLIYNLSNFNNWGDSNDDGGVPNLLQGLKSHKKQILSDLLALSVANNGREASMYFFNNDDISVHGSTGSWLAPDFYRLIPNSVKMIWNKLFGCQEIRESYSPKDSITSPVATSDIPIISNDDADELYKHNRVNPYVKDPTGIEPEYSGSKLVRIMTSEELQNYIENCNEAGFGDSMEEAIENIIDIGYSIHEEYNQPGKDIGSVKNIFHALHNKLFRR